MLNGLGWVLFFGIGLGLFCLGYYLGRTEERDLHPTSDEDFWGEKCDFQRPRDATDDRQWCFTHGSLECDRLRKMRRQR